MPRKQQSRTRRRSRRRSRSRSRGGGGGGGGMKTTSRARSRSRRLRAGGRGNAKKLAAATAAAMGVATAAYLWNQKQKQKLLTPLLPFPKDVDETESLIEAIKLLLPDQYKQKRKSDHLPCAQDLYMRVLAELAKENSTQDGVENFQEGLRKKGEPPMTLYKISIIITQIVSAAFINVMDTGEFNRLLSDRQLKEEFDKFKAKESQQLADEKKLLSDTFCVLPEDEDVDGGGGGPNVPHIKLVRDAIERTFFQNCPE